MAASVADTNDEIQELKGKKINFFNSPPTCPYQSCDWDDKTLTPLARKRITLDYKRYKDDPSPGIFISPVESDMTCVNAMIIGNFDTPYEGGFFHFYCRMPHNYPSAPPRICSVSCYRFGIRVRFNPNLYANGKVCLSVINTWDGPGWLPSMNLASTLQALQSQVFVEKALMNEPGYSDKSRKHAKQTLLYDIYVRHETLRVAVIHTLKNTEKCNISENFVKTMEELFKLYYDNYLQSCDEYSKYDGVKVDLQVYNIVYTPRFAELKKNIIIIHDELEKSGNLKQLQDK